MRRYVAIICIVISTVLWIQCQTDVAVGISNHPYIDYLRLDTTLDASIDFLMVFPENFNEDDAYPVLIAFPPGDQDKEEVDFSLEKYWIKSSIQRNWIVVSPIAPVDLNFYSGAEILIPELMNWIAGQINVEGGKFHLAGLSAGGISAFKIAVENPQRCHSITVLPGYAIEDDYDRLNVLAGIPVSMFVGSNDIETIAPMEVTRDRLLELENTVLYQVIPDDGHVIQSLTSESLFDILDGYRTP